jgi:hypothetical protein
VEAVQPHSDPGGSKMPRLEDFMEIQKLHHDGWACRRRFFREGLIPLDGQPDYDTSYVRHRQAAKDCLAELSRKRLFHAACVCG